VNAVMNTSRHHEAVEKPGDRLKSVPPCVAIGMRAQQGGASPAPTVDGEQSVGVKVALAALRIYKGYLSVLFAGSCRFEPTCSVYAYEAIERFGVTRGSWMGLKRLLRCHPLSRKFGYDPVPEKMEMARPESAKDGLDKSRSDVTPREAHS
jgi:putative membrane protein insertion efficiency factor